MKTCKICGSIVIDDKNICDKCDIVIVIEINELKNTVNKNNFNLEILEK